MPSLKSGRSAQSSPTGCRPIQQCDGGGELNGQLPHDLPALFFLNAKSDEHFFIEKERGFIKANVGEKVLFSRKDFLSLEILLIKKLDFEETKPT